jgi:hypothetical protein
MKSFSVGLFGSGISSSIAFISFSIDGIPISSVDPSRALSADPLITDTEVPSKSY